MRSLFRLDIHIIYSEFISQSSNYTVRDIRKVGRTARLARLPLLSVGISPSEKTGHQMISLYSFRQLGKIPTDP